MGRILALAMKDAILLLRDRAGLAVLFFMPTALVVIVCLIHDAALSTGARASFSILVRNDDRGPLGTALEECLKRADIFRIEHALDDRPVTVASGEKAVLAGRYRALLLVPADASARLKELRDGVVPGAGARGRPTLEVVLDPGMPDSFRNVIMSVLSRALVSAETGVLLEGMRAMGIGVDPATATVTGTNVVPVSRFGGFFSDLRERGAVGARGPGRGPTSTQQNVPAWALFAMFFIVVPLAGHFVAERESGIQRRLLAAPVSYLSVVIARCAVYLVVSLSQFALMLAVGFYLLPLFGVPRLDIGDNPAALWLVAAASGLAAIGYGVAIGTLARTYHQGSTFGAVSIVIAAALGGVMIPVFLMPQAMQTLSRASPLAWGLQAFLKIFLRDAGVREILPDVALLLAFCSASVGLALIYRRLRRG